MRAAPIPVSTGTRSDTVTPGRASSSQLAAGAASLVLTAMFVLSAAWILKDVVPRFQSSPVSSPLQHTVLDGYGKPAALSIQAGAPVELGVAIRPTVAGTVTGLRFYKIKGDLGPHVGSLWSRKGELLATVTFDGESESGWQEATLPAPVDVDADQLLIASYFSPVGGQLISEPTLTADNGPTRSPSPLFRVPPVDSDRRPVNIYHLGDPGFPDTDAGELVFWVDVVFVPAMAAE